MLRVKIEGVHFEREKLFVLIGLMIVFKRYFTKCCDTIISSQPVLLCYATWCIQIVIDLLK